MNNSKQAHALAGWTDPIRRVAEVEAALDKKDAAIERLRVAAELGGVIRDIMEVVVFDGVSDDTVIPIYPAGTCEDARKLTVGKVRALAQLLGPDTSEGSK